MMRAVRKHEFGKPEELVLEELPNHVLGQVRVAVAAGVHLPRPTTGVAGDESKTDMIRPPMS